MSSKTTAANLARQVRSRICLDCPRLPAKEKRNSTDLPHTCEADCPIFARIRALANLADHMDLLISAPDRTARALGKRLSRPEFAREVTHIVEELARRRRFRRKDR